MAARNNTRQVLEHLLAALYSKEASEPRAPGNSYLLAQDGQYLGRIASNTYDNDSILNQYGPYGSQYSMTSIFNPYSEYGSPYGQFSVNNPYSASPPKLFIDGVCRGVVTTNKHLPDGIPTLVFLHMLRKQLPELLAGRINVSPTEARKQQRESFIEAQDGTFLGTLNPNTCDNDSIFNRFGTYGNPFSPDSIFNRFGRYGDRFSQLSVYNEFAISPPKIFLRGQFVGHLTKNPTFSDRVDPDDMLSWAKKSVRYELV